MNPPSLQNQGSKAQTRWLITRSTKEIEKPLGFKGFSHQLFCNCQSQFFFNLTDTRAEVKNNVLTTKWQHLECMITAMVGKVVQLNIGVASIYGKYSFIGKEEVKRNVNAVGRGQHKKDGKSHARRTHGEVVVNRK